MISVVGGETTIWLSRTLLLLSLFYVVPLGVYFLQRWLLPSSPWWFDLADTFALYLFIPTVPLLLLGLLFWSRPVLVLAFFPAAMFTFLYGGLFLTPPHKQTTKDEFTVMTYNVLGMNRNLTSILQLIAKENPDVISMQELVPEIAGPLSSRLMSEYPYQVLAPREDFTGVGVFSRFPLRQVETFKTTSAANVSQHLIVEMNGRELHLFNLHPDHPHVRWLSRQGFPQRIVRYFDTETQTTQVEAMMEKIEEVNGPIVANGDFNLTDQTRQYRRIAKSLTDSHREAGWGFGNTFPADDRFYGIPVPVPLIRIDYVFHSSELVALEAHLGNSAGSDHRPVIVKLGFKG